MTNPMGNRFSASSETLPPSDPRDAAIKSLNAKCRQLIEMAHGLQDSSGKLESAKTADPIDPKTLTDCAVMHGKLEERFRNLWEIIEREHRRYVQDEGMVIFLVHTEAGMPIRVNEKCRKNPWDY